MVVILASRYDFSCDYVVAALRRHGVPYERLNTEDLAGLDVSLDPVNQILVIRSDSRSVELSSASVSAVYFRRPVFVRSVEHVGRLVDRIAKPHWATFVCNLMLFDQCRWMNHPGATYVAEHKGVQLTLAARHGFSVPVTRITNSVHGVEAARYGSNQVAVKGLDTVLHRLGDTETFGYTALLDVEEVRTYDVRSAPFIAQQAIVDKLDLRVTVVGDTCWCASVTRNGRGVDGDWRMLGDEAEFAAFQLPGTIEEQCVALTKQLGLVFSAIDLALHEDRYYFLEINPTGEWAWLHVKLGFPVPEAIVGVLAGAES